MKLHQKRSGTNSIIYKSSLEWSSFNFLLGWKTKTEKQKNQYRSLLFQRNFCCAWAWGGESFLECFLYTPCGRDQLKGGCQLSERNSTWLPSVHVRPKLPLWWAHTWRELTLWGWTRDVSRLLETHSIPGYLGSAQGAFKDVSNGTLISHLSLTQIWFSPILDW